MAKIMLNYRTNGRRRLGRTLKEQLDEVETGVSRSDDGDDEFSCVIASQQ
jgi:hypothetical protein